MNNVLIFGCTVCYMLQSQGSKCLSSGWCCLKVKRMISSQFFPLGVRNRAYRKTIFIWSAMIINKQNDSWYFQKIHKRWRLCKAYKGLVLKYVQLCSLFPNMQLSPTGQQHLIIGLVFHNFLLATCLHYFFVFRPQVQASFYFSFEGRAQIWWQSAF